MPGGRPRRSSPAPGGRRLRFALRRRERHAATQCCFSLHERHSSPLRAAWAGADPSLEPPRSQPIRVLANGDLLRFVDSNERSAKWSKLVQLRPRMEVQTRVDRLWEDRIVVPQEVPRAVGSATAEAPLRSRPAMIYPGRRVVLSARPRNAPAPATPNPTKTAKPSTVFGGLAPRSSANPAPITGIESPT
jgi:hypothetical protein